MQIPYLNKRFGIMAIALVLAVAFHAGALYYLHILDMSFYSLHSAQIENQRTNQAELDSSTPENEIKRRNNELAVIFQDIKPVVEEKISSKEYVLNLTENPTLPSTIHVPEAHLVEPEAEAPLFTPSQVVEALEIAEINEQLQNIVALNNDPALNEIISELVYTTDQLQGHLLNNPKETIQTDNSIQIGSTETSSLDGTTLESHQEMQIKMIDPRTPSEFPSSSTFDLIKPLETAAAVSNASMQTAPGIFKASTSQQQTNLVLPDSNSFNVQISIAPQNGSQEFLFKVTFYPKESIHFKRILQNYFFLIDRSHSIRQQRYELTKKAVSQALAYIHHDDTFNVLVFDDHISSVFPKSMPATPENTAYAQKMIKSQKYGGVFTTTDLYSTLGKILPQQVPEQEVNTVILLSDGDTFLSRERQRETISSWTTNNAGKVSLYTLPTGGGNNLALLGLLSNLNKGALIHARKDREVESSLATLMYQIQHPIGKDLVATAIVQAPATQVTLYPASKRLPNLYENSPYTIYGSTNKLENFYLFIQGRFYEDTLDIKVLVNFNKATLLADGSIERQIAQQRAYAFYESYLNDGKKSHLNAARLLLAPYRTTLPFQ